MSDKLATVDIKGKAYVQVNTRVKEFHRLYPGGSITTELVSEPNANRIVMKATATPKAEGYGDSFHGPRRYFTGYAQEMIGDGFINKASALENCETSAVGRALGFLNIGIDDSIATYEEVEKATDMAKAPELNKPTTQQKQAIIGFTRELGISPTADDNEAYSQYLLEAIGTPSAQNQDQATKLITFMEEDILKREAKRVSQRDE